MPNYKIAFWSKISITDTSTHPFRIDFDQNYTFLIHLIEWFVFSNKQMTTLIDAVEKLVLQAGDQVQLN